jgi:DNA polymerase-3 subunit epsilon
MDFVAIDFETADYGADSACAIGLARVHAEKLVDTATFLIRPPRRRFEFTDIHGITWDMVAEAPDFAQVWRDVRPMLKGADRLVAHNAPFDRAVLRACCASARLAMPRIPFACTVQLARRAWNLYPTKLPDVCRHLCIPLKHHDAASDARACAEIAIAALMDGHSL